MLLAAGGGRPHPAAPCGNNPSAGMASGRGLGRQCLFQSASSSRLRAPLRAGLCPLGRSMVVVVVAMAGRVRRRVTRWWVWWCGPWVRWERGSSKAEHEAAVVVTSNEWQRERCRVGVRPQHVHATPRVRCSAGRGLALGPHHHHWHPPASVAALAHALRTLGTCMSAGPCPEAAQLSAERKLHTMRPLIQTEPGPAYAAGTAVYCMVGCAWEPGDGSARAQRASLADTTAALPRSHTQRCVTGSMRCHTAAWRGTRHRNHNNSRQLFHKTAGITP